MPAGALVALAVPSVASASQPEIPGGSGTSRADAVSNPVNSDAYGTPGASWWGDWASGLAGDNSTTNNEWKADHGYLPVESSLNTP